MLSNNLPFKSLKCLEKKWLKENDNGFVFCPLPASNQRGSDAWGKTQRDKGPLFLPPLVFTWASQRESPAPCPLGDLKKPPHAPK